MATVEQLKKDLEDANEAVRAAGAKRDELQDQLDTARVEAMKPALVKEAKQLGINPRNFEGNGDLGEAIKRVKEDK